MPRLDGIGATRAIRQVCDDYLTKPVNLQILAARIQAFRRVAERGWHLHAQLSAEQLRQVDLVPMVVDRALKMGLPRDRSGDFFIVMTELFVNALDHGLLELPSGLKQATDGFERYFELRQQRLQQLGTGEIQLIVSRRRLGDRDVIGIRLRDSGKGFLHEHYLKVGADQGEKRSGRGIALVRALCRRVEYSGPGNEVYAELEL
jgi:anti-sigma regulatory factor (Ser/Thr protein kinase)